MANYKLVNSDQLDSDLKTVANKIREKAEISNTMVFPSGFISGIDQCSSLNFSVVGGTSQPSSPKENTIWINTSQSITDWKIAAKNPYSTSKDYYAEATKKADYYLKANGTETASSTCTIVTVTLPANAEFITVTCKTDETTTCAHLFYDASGKILKAELRTLGTKIYPIPVGTTQVKLSFKDNDDKSAIVSYLGAAPNGFVVIYTNMMGALSFNALKKNGITVQPISAQQYVSGAWKTVTGKIYQNGWKEFLPPGALYWNGNEFTNITGGWITKALDWDDGSSSAAGAPTLTKNATTMVVTQASGKCGLVVTKNKINTTGYNTLFFLGKMYNNSGSENAGPHTRLALYSAFGNYVTSNRVAYVNNNTKTETQTYSLDISNISETEVYVAFQLYSSGSHVTVEKVWME